MCYWEREEIYWYIDIDYTRKSNIKKSLCILYELLVIPALRVLTLPPYSSISQILKPL